MLVKSVYIHQNNVENKGVTVFMCVWLPDLNKTHGAISTGMRAAAVVVMFPMMDLCARPTRSQG